MHFCTAVQFNLIWNWIHCYLNVPPNHHSICLGNVELNMCLITFFLVVKHSSEHFVQLVDSFLDLDYLCCLFKWLFEISQNTVCCMNLQNTEFAWISSTILCLFHSLCPLLFPHHFLSHPLLPWLCYGFWETCTSCSHSRKLVLESWETGSSNNVFVFLLSLSLSLLFSTSRPLICDDYFE